MKVGVLVFNLGGPESLSDVKPFLYRLFSDPEIIRIKWSPLAKGRRLPDRDAPEEEVRGLLLPDRRRLAAAPADGRAGAALETELRGARHGRADLRRHVHVAAFSARSRRADRRRATSTAWSFFRLFPQYSVTTTGAGSERFATLIDKRPSFKKLERPWISHLGGPSRPTSKSFARAIEKELAKFADPEKVHTSLQRAQHSGKLCARRRSLSRPDEEVRRADHGPPRAGRIPTSSLFKARSAR